MTTSEVAAVLFLTVGTLFLLTAVYIVGRYVAFGPSLDDDLDDVDTCMDCSLVLTERNRAVTCGDHPLCDDCDGEFNPCHVCRYWRHQVTGTDAADWTVGPDPFLDPRGGAA